MSHLFIAHCAIEMFCLEAKLSWDPIEIAVSILNCNHNYNNIMNKWMAQRKLVELLDKKGSKIAVCPINGDRTRQSERISHVPLPPWFDKARFDASRSILSEYFMSIFLCHLSGLVLLIFIKSIYTTLSLTGKSKDLVSIFFRYMHTILHIKLWYEGIVMMPTTLYSR